MIPNKKIRPIYIHILFVLLYALNETTVAIQIGTGAGLWDFIFFETADILLFYALANLVLPMFSKGFWPALAGTLLVPLCWLLFILLYNTINELLNKVYTDRPLIHYTKIHHYVNLYRARYITLIALLFHVRRINIANLREKMRLANAFIKAQVNPHFLFNTLGFIYSSIDRKPEKSKQSLIILSDILRYNLREDGKDGLVPLSDELVEIERYVSLWELRKPNLALALSFQIPKDTVLFVPPLILVTLVENMFQHGVTDDAVYPATVSADIDDGWFNFQTRNEIRLDQDSSGHGIGLRNSTDRLKAAYGKHFRLSSEIIDEQFILNLRIRL